MSFIVTFVLLVCVIIKVIVVVVVVLVIIICQLLQNAAGSAFIGITLPESALDAAWRLHWL